MVDPPSYEESTSESTNSFNDSKTDSKAPLRFSIREEVGASRSQHVAALVAKLLPQIRTRAKQGLSKSTLLLLPSNQGKLTLLSFQTHCLFDTIDASRKGQLVGFPEDETPILIQLEGRQDTLEFWTQEEARKELQSEMLAAISDGLPTKAGDPPLPERPMPSSGSKSSFFSRKQGKAPAVMVQASSVQAPVVVDVQLDEVHFRAETEYGLYETLRCRCLLVAVEVR